MSAITSRVLPTSRPLVFQCRGCRTIISDSTEFVCTLQMEEARFVCLQGATEVRVDSIPTTTAAPHSVHFAVCCACCGAAVGRLYTQAPQAVSAALNLFCLDVHRCLTHDLGSADMRAPGAQPAGSSGQAAHSAAAAAAQQQQQQQQQPGSGAGIAQQQPGGAAAGAAAAVDAGLVLELLRQVEHLEATLCTVQGMQVLHDDQLRRLPGYQENAGAQAGMSGL